LVLLRFNRFATVTKLSVSLCVFVRRFTSHLNKTKHTAISCYNDTSPVRIQSMTVWMTVCMVWMTLWMTLWMF
jgi:hypothetical protein